MKQTSVEWLEEKAKEFSIDLDLLNYFEQAKEMQKIQSHSYAEFAIRCDRMNMKILNFEDFIKLETYNK